MEGNSIADSSPINFVLSVCTDGKELLILKISQINQKVIYIIDFWSVRNKLPEFLLSSIASHQLLDYRASSIEEQDIDV